MSELASVASGAPKVTHVIARQVIVDFKRKVFGYELFDRSVAHHLHTAASDAELLFNALSHSEYQEMLTLKPLFVNCTHESLAGGHLELINPERVVLEIPALNGDHIEDIEDRRHVLEDLRGRGFRWLSNTGSLAPRTHPGCPLLHLSRLT
jgi:c-di-GMP-related signal transduction protein